MGGYYWRDGTPMSMEEWSVAYEKAQRDGTVRVALTVFPGDVQVSTVWLGLDHSFGYGPPLIFESMVFGLDAAVDDIMRRYSTEEQAMTGHLHMVAMVRQVLELRGDAALAVPFTVEPEPRDEP